MRERRSNSTELRAAGRIIKGLAARFNALSEDLGGFVETLAPGCFDLDSSPSVILNYDHNDRDILARTESGTLKLTQDDVGLWYEAELPNTTLANDLIELINRGDLRGCSFAFNLADDASEEWGTTPDGKRLRTVKKVILYDVCVTPCPAYLDTEVALRRLHSINTKDALQQCRERLLRASLEIAESKLHR